MPQRIARHIVAYLEQLERTRGLHITLHPMGGALQPYLPILNPYNIHHNPYCLLVKTSAAAWNRCVARQGRVCTACRDEAVFGMCYAGVEEFVFPIHPGGDEGFVSVSGYATHPERALPRIRAVAAEYVLDHGELLRTHQAGLRTDAPTLPDLEPWIAPLCDMLRLLRQLSPYEPQRPASVHARWVRCRHAGGSVACRPVRQPKRRSPGVGHPAFAVDALALDWVRRARGVDEPAEHTAGSARGTGRSDRADT